MVFSGLLYRLKSTLVVKAALSVHGAMLIEVYADIYQDGACFVLVSCLNVKYIKKKVNVLAKGLLIP